MFLNWAILLLIVIVGTPLCGFMCAVLEERLTGRVRHSIDFKKMRLTSHIISLFVGSLAANFLYEYLSKEIYLDHYWQIGFVCSISGAFLYLILDSIIYWMMLKKYQNKKD
jgi:hypothetical protein